MTWRTRWLTQKSRLVHAGRALWRSIWGSLSSRPAGAGGSEAARDADANGPNASREMLRFFLQHRLLASGPR